MSGREASSLAKARRAHAPVFAELGSQARPDGHRNSRGHDRDGAEDANFRSDQMHRTSAASRTARALSEEFRHHFFEASPFGEVVAVRSMTAENVIVGPQNGANSGCDRLLPDAQVARASDFSFFDEFRDALFGAADAQHGRIQTAQKERVCSVQCND